MSATMSKPPAIRQPWPKTRQSSRQPVEGRLTIVAPDGKVRGWLHDISEVGVGGVVAVQLESGTEVELEFELAGQDAPLHTRAAVRYSNGFRYGFHFLELTSDQKDAIQRYCATAAVPPRPAPDESAQS
jgi:PilZ domain